MPPTATRPPQNRIPSRATTLLHISGHSVREVADAYGCARPFISYFLTGRAVPNAKFWTAVVAVASDDVADQIAAALGVVR